MDDWKDISSYDGTFAVLLYFKEDGLQAVGGRDGGGWYICGIGTQYHQEDEFQPTHWRDLGPGPA